jgi:hypothetical protein
MCTYVYIYIYALALALTVPTTTGPAVVFLIVGLASLCPLPRRPSQLASRLRAPVPVPHEDMRECRAPCMSLYVHFDVGQRCI